jgi:hypothetical protein
LTEGTDTILTSIVVFGIGRDSTVYVMDKRKRSIHHFSNTGDYLGGFGGQGSGPGEFQKLTEATVIDDQLWVWDSALNRVSVFSTSGLFLFSLNSVQSFPGAPFPLYKPNDTFHVVGSELYIGWPGGELSRGTFSILTVNKELTEKRTLIEIVVKSEAVQIGSAIQPTSNVWEILTPIIAYRAGLPIAWSYDEGYRVHLFDPIRCIIVNIDISDYVRPKVGDEEVEQILNAYRERGVGPEAVKKLIFPKTHRSVAWLRWDDIGRLWIGNWPEYHSVMECWTYQVFDSSGIWLFTQELPKPPNFISSLGFYWVDDNEERGPQLYFYLFNRSKSG